VSKVELLQAFDSWNSEVGPDGLYTQDWVHRGIQICSKLASAAQSETLRQVCQDRLTKLNRMKLPGDTVYSSDRT
jgi:hypothetical protein